MAGTHSESEEATVTKQPGGLMADSPVTFPKEGGLPANYQPGRFVSPEEDWKHLQQTRRILTEGGVSPARQTLNT